MSRFRTEVVDGGANILQSPTKPEDAAERQQADKSSKASNFPLTTNPMSAVGKPPRIAAERPQADKPTKAWNFPLIQLQPPSVTKVVAHDPVQKFMLGTRFVPLKSLGLHIPTLTIDLEPVRRYSIDPTVNVRYSIMQHRRRYRLIVEGNT